MLEIRVPLSPRPAWLNRMRLLTASIKQFYPDSVVRAYLGKTPDVSPYDIQRANYELCGMGIEWIKSEEFVPWAGGRAEYLTSMMRRYYPGNFVGTHVLFLDCDVICTKRFDELFAMDAICGVQAHVPPISISSWRELFARFGVRSEFNVPYSGNGFMNMDPNNQFTSWYPNSGMIFGPRAHFEALAEPYAQAIEFLRRTMADHYWFDQLGLALGAAAAGVPLKSLPPRYNFPNQPAFDAHYPEDLADVRFIHYLRTDTVHRDTEFEDIGAIGKLCRRKGLFGSN